MAEERVTEQGPRWVVGAKKRPPKRTPLSVERIVEAAFALMADEGYDAVTMRRVAQQLGTGPASLYAHVENKAELDQLLVAEMSKMVVVPEPDPDNWQEQTKQVMRDMRAAMNAHPGVARATLGMIPMTEDALISGERILAILIAGGVHPQVAGWALDLMPLYAGAIAFEESVRQPFGSAPYSKEQESEFREQITAMFASLPADRFPLMSSMAAVLAAGGGDDRFEFGLSVLVAGLAAVSDSWRAH